MLAEIKPSQLRSLTGLRFFAAIFVVLGHYLFYFSQAHQQRQVQGLGFYNILTHHAVGVDLFFILSGFILTYNYADSSRGLRGTRRSFWIARIARIYPVYLLGLALDFVRFLEQAHHSAGGMVVTITAHPLLLQAWFPTMLDWSPSVQNTAAWDPPAWSVSCEALFYLLFPFLLVVMWRLSLRVLLGTAAFCYLISLAVPAALITGRHFLPYGAHGGVPWWLGRVLYYNPLLRLPEFVLGMGLGLLFMRQKVTTRPLLASRSWLPALASLVSLAVLLVALAVQLPDPSNVYPTDIIFSPLLAVFIFSLGYNSGPLAYFLSTRLLVLLGEASYAIYIYHWPLWFWTTRLNMFVLHMPTSSPELGVTYFFLVIALSVLSFQYVERPARAAIRARFAQGRDMGTNVLPTDHVRRHRLPAT